MGEIQKKVYEGYRRTNSSSQSANVQVKPTTVSSRAKKTAKSSSPSSKTPNAKLVNKISVTKPRLAMFIDVDNVGITRENLLEILFYANGKYKIEVCKLYGFSDTTLPGIKDIAGEYNVVTVGKMKFKQPNVNCLDSRLIIDAYECALNNKNKIDMIFVWCYPCDLSDLFEKMIALGVNTATINNNIFDCKNKFVSQTFKLYSPYNFNLEQSMYGKVKNEPTEVNANQNLAVEASRESLENQTKVSQNATTETKDAQSNMIDGVVPPVLPRRSIPERSNSNAPKLEPQVEPESNAEMEPESTSDEAADTEPKSLVEEIARKLNLQMPTEEEVAAEEEASSHEHDALVKDMLKRAGFSNLLDKNELKYEDTIGDL